MSDLETSIKDAWVSYIAAHDGHTARLDEIKRSVFRERQTAFTSTTSTQHAPVAGDFARLEKYIDTVDPEKFKRDVSYQLYYVTECLIWLWKRLPRGILIRDEGRNGQDKVVDALLRDLNAGTLISKLTPDEKAALPDVKQGKRATPADGAEVIVKRGEFDDAHTLREVALTAQSHEPPPPPPGWPGE